MSKVDREATFKGRIVDCGVTTTREKGLPQFVVTLSCDEIYDPDEQKFVDYSDEDQQCTGYLVLYGKNNKATFHVDSLKKTLGWNGKSFSGLAGGDYSDLIVQFRTEENFYDNKTTIQLVTLNSEDANPERQLTKFDAVGLEKLDAVFSKQLRSDSGTIVATGPKKIKGKASVPKATPPKPPGKKGPPVPAAGQKPVDECTRDEAWAAIEVSVKERKDLTEENVMDQWAESIAVVLNDADEGSASPVEWAKIRDHVVTAFAIPF